MKHIYAGADFSCYAVMAPGGAEKQDWILSRLSRYAKLRPSTAYRQTKIVAIVD